ncbi:hypothetical protein Acr_10g0001190 [Actinidia rufa]|uniref:Uncharacterized protein n=1 Tax=Actinidia rufa TaxID=165716 RepID=A0A7J0F7R1_9ERIC|nr:hypothetical protein Acr_10g0001190 [Actinidia rufa]
MINVVRLAVNFVGVYEGRTGTVTLEKPKSNLSQKQRTKESIPEIDPGGGDGGIGKGINFGGGGGGGADNEYDDNYVDDFDDGDEGDEGGLFMRQVVILENDCGSFIFVPALLRAGCHHRLLCLVGVEKSQGEEWDLALINILTLTACNAIVVWSLAPCRSYGNTFQFDLQNTVQKLPNNIFEKSYPLREFDLQKRIQSFVYKAAELCMVGCIAGAFQVRRDIKVGLVRLGVEVDPQAHSDHMLKACHRQSKPATQPSFKFSDFEN